MPKRLSSSTMILENSIGQALIVKANYKPYWTFPGGIIDEGETPKEAAIRETCEEIGLTIPSSSVTFIAIVDRRSNMAETYQFVFQSVLAPDMVRKIVLQVSEIDEYALVTREQVMMGGRNYGKVIKNWATGTTGYIEQTFVVNGE
jgi:8-oxo-dGTP diphosphatase